MPQPSAPLPMDLDAEGSLPAAHRSLVAHLKACRDSHAPELHVYDLWRGDMKLPAIWTWIAPGTVGGFKDQCRVEVTHRVVIVVAVNPAARLDQDARRLLDYAEILQRHFDRVLYGTAGASRASGLERAKSAAWSTGAQLTLDKLGSVDVTCYELPIDVTLSRRLDDDVHPAP